MPRNARQSSPILHIKCDRQSIVADLSDELGLSYKIVTFDRKPNIVEFRFDSMSDEKLLALVNRVPPEAFAYRAEVGGEPPKV
jgi:hypothetical protein